MTDKETMAIIKQMVADGQISQEVAEKYFPELKPEDERIINALIRLLRQCAHDGYDNVVEGVGIPEAIAWLEKQGEQKSTLPKWKYKKDNTPLLRDSLILNKYGCVAKSPSGAIVSDVWVIDYDELAKLPKDESEKQGEQKPADKDEPKFKIGDEIKTKNEESFIITRIDRWGYWSEDLFICNFDDADKWELVEQKPAEWSEEDESIYNAILDAVNKDLGLIGVHRDWFKNIKYRLKSIILQNRWKPTEEQMKALRAARSIDGVNHVVLASLIYDLEKLMK